MAQRSIGRPERARRARTRISWPISAYTFQRAVFHVRAVPFLPTTRRPGQLPLLIISATIRPWMIWRHTWKAGLAARRASRQLARLDGAAKIAALQGIAAALRAGAPAVLSANAADLAARRTLDWLPPSSNACV